MPRVVWFEIPADDPARAIKFYETVFGWKITKFEGPMDYWMVTTGEAPEPMADGAIMPRQMGQHIRNSIDVTSIDESVAQIEAAGGKLLMPKMEIPGGLWAMCADSEGNEFGLVEPAPGDMVR